MERREKKTINSSLTEFLFDGVNPVQETSGSVVLANTMTGLEIDEFLTRTDVGAGTIVFFLFDALGSAIALTDSAGAVQTEYSYEPFGHTTVAGSVSTNPFRFTGREDDGTGLYYYRARHYHPQFQRFSSEDPIEFFGGDTNLYTYTWNDPVNYPDPSGNGILTWIATKAGKLGRAIVLAWAALKHTRTPTPPADLGPRGKPPGISRPKAIAVPNPGCGSKSQGCSPQVNDPDYVDPRDYCYTTGNCI